MGLPVKQTSGKGQAACSQEVLWVVRERPIGRVNEQGEGNRARWDR